MSKTHCLLMRRDLSAAIAAPQWPAGISLQRYSPEQAEAVHQLLHLGYQDGGDVPLLDSWRQAFETDAEYDPELCLVVRDAAGVIAVAHCWTSAYLKDLVVHPRARGQGLGRTLLQQVFALFAERREAVVDLRVLAGNLRARSLYESIGMYIVRHETLD